MQLAWCISKETHALPFATGSWCVRVGCWWEVSKSNTTKVLLFSVWHLLHATNEKHRILFFIVCFVLVWLHLKCARLKHTKVALVCSREWTDVCWNARHVHNSHLRKHVHKLQWQVHLCSGVTNDFTQYYTLFQCSYQWWDFGIEGISITLLAPVASWSALLPDAPVQEVKMNLRGWKRNKFDLFQPYSCHNRHTSPLSIFLQAWTWWFGCATVII